jgi:hypothetical protein
MAVDETERKLFWLIPSASWAVIGSVLFFLPLLLAVDLIFSLLVIAAALVQAVTTSVAMLIAAVCSRSWTPLLSAISAPAVFVSAALLAPNIGLTPDLVRFVICKPWYDWKVASRARAPGEPKLVFFGWAEVGNFLGGHIDVLVYDESGEIMRLPGRPSLAWQARAANSPHWLSVEGWGANEARQLLGHYYLATGRW